MENVSIPFVTIATLIRKLNVNDDSIVMDRKIKDITQDFLAIIMDNDYSLKDALTYFNEESLKDSNFAINFSLLFSSKVFNGLVNSSKFRLEIIKMLETNFHNSEDYKKKDPKQFYNSITLLGEFFHRYRISDRPYRVLGAGLFSLLIKELQTEITKCLEDSNYEIDVIFSQLILTQVSLNGSMSRQTHSKEINELFYEIRKCLIEVQNLKSHVKAFFLMTLDLYYNNFASIDSNLEKFYERFLNDMEQSTSSSTLSSTGGHSEQTDSKENVNECTTDNENFGEEKKEEKRKTLSNALKSDVLGQSAFHGQQNKIIKEHIGKPLKASERLKFAQKGCISANNFLQDESEEAAMYDKLSDFSLTQKIPTNDNEVENVENVETVETVNNVENVENVEHFENIENMENVENVNNGENVNNPENVNNAENVENIENVKPIENTENVENVEIVKELNGEDKLCERLENVNEVHLTEHLPEHCFPISEDDWNQASHSGHLEALLKLNNLKSAAVRKQKNQQTRTNNTTSQSQQLGFEFKNFDEKNRNQNNRNRKGEKQYFQVNKGYQNHSNNNNNSNNNTNNNSNRNTQRQQRNRNNGNGNKKESLLSGRIERQQNPQLQQRQPHQNQRPIVGQSRTSASPEEQWD